jgi:hypothetical protein
LGYETAGRYLPQYSPDLDPIARLKAVLREAAAGSVRSLWRRSGSLIQTFSPQQWANFLRHAGYVAT